MKKILSVIMALVIFAMSFATVTAVSVPDTAKAVFTFSDVSADIGDSISIQVSLKSTEEVNTIALSGFTYDAEGLTFTGFSDYDEISSLAAITPTFDNTNKAVVVGLRSAMCYDGNVCKLNFTVNKPGTYTVSATALAKYNSTTVEAFVVPSIVSVAKKELTVSGITVANKVYDGTTDAVISGGTLVGIDSGDDVSIAGTITGSFADENCGNNISVNIDNITLGGADKDNYTLTQPTGLKANITKRPITVTARSYTIKKNNAVPTLEYDITSGSLVSGDALSGALSVNADGTTVGTFDINQGSLSAGTNYNLTFVKGTLAVNDKDPQNITVNAIGSKTYGDAPFVLSVTDNSTGLGALAYESSNTDVAEISADGTVTIKTAGTTNITVSRSGNADYADFSDTKTLTVVKRPITVTARSYSIKKNNAVPTLEYDITSGSLVSGDALSGALGVNADGTALGEYDITQGTLTAGNNYNITFVKGTLTVVDKTPQNITVGVIGSKTYGDSSFAISVTADTTANLTDYTYQSSNTDVAEIAADGTITIKAAGTTNITVNEPGNDEYASFTNTQELVVNKKNVTVTSVNLGAKTAVLEGVLAEDASVALDFDKLNLTITGAIDETTSNVTVTTFELKGEKSENYAVSTTSLDTTIATDNTVVITITATNGTAIGAGTYLKDSNVTVSATANSGYRFNGWCVGDTIVSTNATYTFVADSDKALEAKFSRISTGGSGTSYYTVKFDTNGGSTIKNLSVRKNGVVSEPEAPKKDGYTFEGWYTDKELTTAYDFTAKVTKSMTLYAKWTENDTTNNQIILTIGDKNAKVFGENKANDVAPKIVKDRTMLPARFVAENLGAKVEWIASERRVKITKESIEIIIIIDSDIAYVNGKEVKLDSSAFIENDRTYTPVRFVAEKLGAKVDWEEGMSQVIITKE